MFKKKSNSAFKDELHTLMIRVVPLTLSLFGSFLKGKFSSAICKGMKQKSSKQAKVKKRQRSLIQTKYEKNDITIGVEI